MQITARGLSKFRLSWLSACDAFFRVSFHAKIARHEVQSPLILFCHFKVLQFNILKTWFFSVSVFYFINLFCHSFPYNFTSFTLKKPQKRIFFILLFTTLIGYEIEAIYSKKQCNSCVNHSSELIRLHLISGDFKIDGIWLCMMAKLFKFKY